MLVPRLGYCDYGCNNCGQVCPSGAIPPLGLEEKRERVIGHAYIDRSRCIPWVDNRNRIVCEELWHVRAQLSLGGPGGHSSAGAQPGGGGGVASH